MFTLLIAEDELIELNYLEKMLKKANLPIDRIYTATNGAQAIELYQQHQPDILLMDINMPICNGLEALKVIRKMQLKESICFILTSYDYFSYAQEAIRLGVEDFILKPSEIGSIIAGLSQAIAKLKKQQNRFQQTSALVEKMNHIRPVLENECAYALLTGQEEVKLRSHLQLLNIHAVSGCCIVFDESCFKETEIQQIKKEIEDFGIASLITYIKPNHVMFLLAGYILTDEDVHTIINLLKDSLMGRLYGVGSIQKEVENLYQSYRHALLDIRKSQPYRKEETQQLKQQARLWANKLYEYQDTKGETELKNEIREFVMEVIQKTKDGNGNTLLFEMITQLSRKFKLQYDIVVDEQDTIESIRMDFQQPSATLEANLTYKLYNFLRTMKMMKYQQLDHLSRTALDYIEKNYAKAISLNDVAQALHVSSSHLSRVLSKNNEKSFTDIVNECRIKEAKYLIRQHVILKDVAFHVGFRSQSYFAKTFKKIVGMSPKEYQNLF